jgi:DNA-binding MarR family transcriptional regulator
VSLQGSLEGFPLPDVLALLASTKKSGELRVAGHRGTGRVWLSEGAVAGVEAGDATTSVDALFQLLRVEEGSFTFDPGAAGPDARPEPLESLLTEAQTRLADWRAIEAVVPSLATSVRLADELRSPKVSVSASQWRVLRTVAAGATVADVAGAMELDEFGACQAVKHLVDAGLVEVETSETDAHRRPTAASVAETQVDEDEEEDEEEPAEERRSTPDLDELVSIPAHMRRTRRAPAATTTAAPRRSRLAEAAARRRQAPTDDLVGAAAAALTPENADALVRELAELGADVSEAAGVIEAASRVTSTEERAAALEGVLANDDGEPLNRALLMKFLSSVRS